jgi:alpha-beta hydrolase superfamily lysophospholipase
MNAKLTKFITASLASLFLLGFSPTAAVQAYNTVPVIPRVDFTSDSVILVALHGFGLSRASYAQLAKKLEGQGVVFEALDVRGFGEKSSSRLDFTEASTEISEHLNALRRQYPSHKLLLLGESMGGALALKVAAENPALVDGVIASEPAYKVNVNPLVYPEVILSLLFRPSSPNRIPLGYAKRVTTVEPFLSDLKAKLKIQRGYSASELWRFRALMKSVPAAVAQLCQTPVLFLQGDSDRLVKPSGTSILSKIAALAPHKLVTFRKRGHLLLEENQASDDVVSALESWISERASTSNQQIAKVFDSQRSQLLSSTQISQQEDR